MISIIIDEREHQLFEKMTLCKEKENFGLIELKKQVLPLGDIVINCLTEIKNKKNNSKIKTKENKIIDTDTTYTREPEPEPTNSGGEPEPEPTNTGGEPEPEITEPGSQTIAIIERKTFTDLFASIKGGRYTEQSYRLSNSIDISQTKIFYIIEGMISTLSNKEQKLLHSTITSLEIFKGFSVLRTQNAQETAEFILTMADKIYRDLKNKKQIFGIQKNTTITEPKKPYCSVVKTIKKDNITPQNIGEIVLCQIPGISSVTAVSVMKHFSGSFVKLLETVKEDPKCLEKIQYETNGKLRKINKSTAETIIKYF